MNDFLKKMKKNLVPHCGLKNHASALHPKVCFRRKPAKYRFVNRLQRPFHRSLHNLFFKIADPQWTAFGTARFGNIAPALAWLTTGRCVARCCLRPRGVDAALVMSVPVAWPAPD